MGAMKTPGVYIDEKSAFPNSVVEVETAVPAFIGYTGKADNKGKTLLNKPFRITSMAEFHDYFGFGPNPVFTIEENSDENVESDFNQAGKAYVIKQSRGKYLLYYSMKLFYQNGGGPCYIVSIGTYQKGKGEQTIDPRLLKAGIKLLIEEKEPTMVVIPKTILLSLDDSINVQQASLSHSGGKMKNRVSILDIHDGHKERQDPDGDPVAAFRNLIGTNYLDFATVYYPWINTTIVQDDEISYENFDETSLTLLKRLIATDMRLYSADQEDARVKESLKQIESLSNKDEDWLKTEEGEAEATKDDIPLMKRFLHASLVSNSSLFKTIMKESKNKLNLLPPAAAIAGIYTMVDNTKGVWKAPANVGLNAVVSPVVDISHDDQEDLNVTPQGKSINAIRAFIGEGTKVWGSRTLDGNSLDWRYINVRRTMIMLEESIKLAVKGYEFENNDANTWVTIKSMIQKFLTDIWKRGGLAGTNPDHAFSVYVGLGETMTPEDILESILIVTVLVALVRPAEFVEISFQQQMQKS